MKVIIFAGGFGTRLGNRTDVIPKPMVKIGRKPIIWHIMKSYSYYGINEFVICLGYKGDVIKDYFLNYEAKNNDFTIQLGNSDLEFHNNHNEEDWKVTLVDTGLNTLKGGRLKRIEDHVDDDVNLLTYGDGVSDIDINELLEFHNDHDKMVTITGVHPPARFGELIEENNVVKSFEEKPQTSQGLINGGFMVFNKGLFNHLRSDEDCDFEVGPLEKLSKQDKVMVYKHEGNWECMDHERDVQHLNKLWNANKAFWKVW
jgi:glucose-1-phosphate cytidylyltransferase